MGQKRRKKTNIKSKPGRPRLSVFKSNSHISAQVIDDDKGETLASASSLKLSGNGSNIAAAQEVGKELAVKLKSINVEKIVFDRGSYVFKGRVQALAKAVAENGVEI